MSATNPKIHLRRTDRALRQAEGIALEKTARRVSEERFRLLFESSRDAIMTLEPPSWRFTSGNPATVNMFRAADEQDFIARQPWTLSPERQLDGRLSGEKAKEMIETAMREGFHCFEWTHARIGGEEFPADVLLTRIELGGKAFLQATVRDITEQKRLRAHIEISRDILQILNEPGSLQDCVQLALAALKTRTGFDAAGIRLQDGDDFPYFAQKGLSADFLLTENTLIARTVDGGVCRDKNGNACLECTCGLVLSGKIPPAHPFFTSAGSFWTNDSFPLLDLPTDQDPRIHPRNICIHHGYASVALVPIRNRDRIVGLIHINDRRKGCFTLEIIELLEGVASSVGSALMRKQAEGALRDSEQRYRALFEGATEGILVANVETRKFHYANPAICKLLGYTAEELTQMDVQCIHPAESFPAVCAAFEAQARGELRLAVELPCLRKNGEILYVNVNTARVEIDGRPSLVGFFSDITEGKRHEAERRKLEKQLHEKQKLAAVGTLACGMGHEINNPIMGIINYAQLIKDRLQGKDEALEEFADEIVIEAERIAGIVRGLSAFATRDTATRAVVPVSEFIDAALSPMRAMLTHDHITLAVDVPDDLPTVLCDPRQIEQVLTSLVSNARDALNEKYPGHDENKKVVISATEVTMSLGNADRRIRAVRLTVEDHGTGIPEAVQSHIFEPFFTTKDKSVGAGSIGKGLGLFVSYAIVQEHEGSLRVESPSTALRAGEGGQWTRFHIELPVVSKMTRNKDSKET
jgi:PAS domain S-box-containing protein